MLDFDKFTNYSQEMLSASSALMDSYKNTQLEPEHILLAMVKDDGPAKDYLTELKLLNQNFINKLVAKVEGFPKLSGGVMNSQGLYLSADSRRLLELAMEQAKLMKDDYVGIESILLAMTKLENSPIKTLLADFGVTGNSVLNAMKKIRGNKKVDSKNAEEKYCS